MLRIDIVAVCVCRHVSQCMMTHAQRCCLLIVATYKLQQSFRKHTLGLFVHTVLISCRSVHNRCSGQFRCAAVGPATNSIMFQHHLPGLAIAASVCLLQGTAKLKLQARLRVFHRMTCISCCTQQCTVHLRILRGMIVFTSLAEW